MPQKSGFFDTTADDPRDYPAREFAEYFARFVGNGIFSGGTKLKVSATGTNANVKIEIGFGWINGYLYSVYDEALTLTVQPATNADRIDRVILRLDTSTPVRAIRAMVLQGNPAATPVVPAITRSGDVYDLSLAQILVKANTSVVLPENITDERLNSAVCGVVTGLIQQADTTAIFNQFQAWLNTKTAEYQAEWRAFLESVQDEGFATTQYVDNRVLTGGYGATTNSANAYSVTLIPAPTALVAGLRATVRINAANTGVATLNVNGLGAKSILKSNGTVLTSGYLKVNSVYSLVYNGTNFILQGEGGEYGTAVAAEVLAPKTIGTEIGIVTGTMPDRGAGGTVIPGTADQVKAAGYYNSAITIKGDPNLIASNIKKNVPLYGLVGTAAMEFEPGDFSIYTRSTYTGQSNSSMRMVGGVTPSIGGTYRVSFHMTRNGGVSAWSEARIYVNGVPRGTLRTVVNTTYTEDITIKAGEEIQFWIRSGNAENYVYVQNVTLSVLYSQTERST
ncbi:hypothetical protein [Paenibacillus sp. FSL R7-0026]|uniref:hypothetical protein n=1 Tax=Paenibacillus sp. FSL R7-0026 TaxID=2921668 RepID=UPI0030F88D52